MKSTSEALMLEKMEKCNCGKNLEVIFVCLKSEQECKDSKTQKYYCIKCSAEDKHDHKSVVIVNELEIQHKNWLTFIAEISTIFSAAEIAYKKFLPLIVYLEEAMMQPGIKILMPSNRITNDFNLLKGLHINALQLNNDQIKKLVTNAKLLELF